jgi:hypothetical protein
MLAEHEGDLTTVWPGRQALLEQRQTGWNMDATVVWCHTLPFKRAGPQGTALNTPARWMGQVRGDDMLVCSIVL